MLWRPLDYCPVVVIHLSKVKSKIRESHGSKTTGFSQ
jgi:hypothetical protein